MKSGGMPFDFSDRETNCILTLSFIYVKRLPET